MTTRRAVMALVLLCGCGGTEGECELALRVGTFNTGFARGDIAYVEERVPLVTAALGVQDLDVLCVQEVWLDWGALTSATAARLPNTVRTERVPDCTNPACTAAEMDPLLACGEQNCAGLVGDALLQCGQDSCPTEVGMLSAGCLSCIIEAAPGGMSAMQASCVGGATAGTSYLYNCHYDVGILARVPLLARSSRKLDSYFVAASVDFARVPVGGSEFDVYCTHLASEVGSIPYAGAFGSWKEEQAAQIEQLLAFIDETSDGLQPVVLMGDLNTGPDEWPEHFQRLLDAGFVKPPDVDGAGACTVCADNSFRMGEASHIVDHVLVRGAEAAPTERFMRERVPVAAQETNYSDHYGVRTSVDACPP